MKTLCQADTLSIHMRFWISINKNRHTIQLDALLSRFLFRSFRCTAIFYFIYIRHVPWTVFTVCLPLSRHHHNHDRCHRHNIREYLEEQEKRNKSVVAFYKPHITCLPQELNPTEIIAANAHITKRWIVEHEGMACRISFTLVLLLWLLLRETFKSN